MAGLYSIPILQRKNTHMNTLVMYHSKDLDGLLSGAIANFYITKRANPTDRIELIGVDYGEAKIKEIDYKNFDVIYVIDFSDDWLFNSDHRSKIIWIDHHITAIDKKPTVMQFCINDVAACRLTLQFFSNIDYAFLEKETFQERRVMEPLLVTLAGEHDVWDHKNIHSKHLSFGLSSPLSFPFVSHVFEKTKHILTEQDPWSDIDKIYSNDLLSHICSKGEGVLSFIQRTQNDVQGVSVKINGLVGRAFNTHIRSSLIYETKGEDFTMVWNYDGGAHVKVSLYSENKDVSVIASTFGGGGHKKACGFKLPIHLLTMILSGVDILCPNK